MTDNNIGIITATTALAGLIIGLFTWLHADISKIHPRIDETNRRIDESSMAINQRINETNRRIDESNKAINQRIDESNKAINQRIDGQGRQIDKLAGEVAELRGTIRALYQVSNTSSSTPARQQERSTPKSSNVPFAPG